MTAGVRLRELNMSIMEYAESLSTQRHRYHGEPWPLDDKYVGVLRPGSTGGFLLGAVDVL